MKKYKGIHASTNSDAKFVAMQDIIRSDYERGIDPLYKNSDAADYFNDIMQDIEEEIGLFLEPSIQGGQGKIDFYDTDDNDEYMGWIDYAKFNDGCVRQILRSEDLYDFKYNYEAYVSEVPLM